LGVFGLSDVVALVGVLDLWEVVAFVALVALVLWEVVAVLG